MQSNDKVFVTISGICPYRKQESSHECYTTNNGLVYHYVSNDRCVPDDVLKYCGIVPSPEHVAARDKQNDEFMAEYRSMRQEHGYSDEEKAEMRAAFGPGTELVDVISGNKIAL